MGDVNTGPDSIRVYLSGAASDGGVQTDHNASLGLYRSLTELVVLGITVTGGPANITVDYAGGANGEGSGSVSAESADTLAWTPPGGAMGDPVTIANGETKVLIGGGANPQKYVRVTRTSVVALSGTATAALAYAFNNAVGFDNVSVAEQVAGDTEYRALFFKNGSAYEAKSLTAWLGAIGTANTVDAGGYAAGGAVTVTITAGNLNDWPDSGYVKNDDAGEVMYYTSRTASAFTVPAAGRDVWVDVAGGAAGTSADVLLSVPGVRIAKEVPSGQPTGFITDKTVAGEGSQPAGFTWVHPTAVDDAVVVTIGDLAAGYIYGLWLERIIIAGATAEASVYTAFQTNFEAL